MNPSSDLNRNRTRPRPSFTTDPARLYGYPAGWTRTDPRNRDTNAELFERLENLELLVGRLVEIITKERLP
ncbi:hypothetical protein BH23CHL7_BH23CHL7_20830 [soil metagenome]